MKNERELALKKIQRIEDTYGRLINLRKAANDLIEAHIPEKYKDGDIRLVNKDIYGKLQEYAEEIKTLEGFTKDQVDFMMNYDLIYRGPFGKLIIKEA